MALTTCPVCKEKVSNSAALCVHCGCKLICCPECGMLSTEGTEICSECGAKLQTQKEVSPSPANPTQAANNSESFSSLIQKWKKEDTSVVLLDIFVQALSLIIVASFLISAVVYYFARSLPLFCLLLVGCFIGNIASDIIGYIIFSVKSKKLLSFIKKNNYSAKDFISKGFSENEQLSDVSARRKHTKNLNFAIESYYCNSSRKNASKHLLVCVTCYIITMIGFLLMSIALVSVFEGNNLISIICLLVSYLTLVAPNKLSIKTGKKLWDWAKNEYGEKAD